MHTIRVSSSFNEPGSRSLSGAMQSAKETHRRRVEASRWDKTPLMGKALVGATWTDCSLTLLFTEGIQLIFHVRERQIDWRFEQSSGAMLSVPNPIDPVLLIFEGSEQGHVWDRRELIAKRQNREFRDLFFGHSVIYLYFAKSPILMLSCPLSTDNQKELLFWSDTD